MTSKSFEFGVSLGYIDFVQNEQNVTTEEGYKIVQSLIDRKLIESEEKTMGMVIMDEVSTEVSTRLYIENGWEWDFDTKDTKCIKISNVF